MYDIINYPDYRLRKISKCVNKTDINLILLYKIMINVIDNYLGIGLALNQIGIFKRIILVKFKNKNWFLINPKITQQKKTQKLIEGCLSIKKFYYFISRSKNIVVNFQNKFGINKNINSKNLISSCIQHEIDHLDGILFIDHLNLINFLYFLNFFLETYENPIN